METETFRSYLGRCSEIRNITTGDKTPWEPICDRLLDMEVPFEFNLEQSDHILVVRRLHLPSLHWTVVARYEVR